MPPPFSYLSISLLVFALHRRVCLQKLHLGPAADLRVGLSFGAKTGLLVDELGSAALTSISITDATWHVALLVRLGRKLSIDDAYDGHCEAPGKRTSDYWHIRYSELNTSLSSTPHRAETVEDDEQSISEFQLRKFQKELSAGTVSLALLAVLASSNEPMYGYQIAKRLETFGEGVLSGKQSALYPVLRNLGKAGLLDSHIEPSMSGPPRRYYRLTEAGQTTLRTWAAAWQATRDSVDAVLEGLMP